MATTAAEQAYDAIRTMIVRLELAPGSVLNESALMDQLSLGRTPIREALQRLGRDQLVNILPRRGAFVTSLDIGDLPVLFSSRAVIEPHLAELAAHRGSERHWNDIEAALSPTAPKARATKQSAKPSAGEAADEMLEVDHRCHAIVWAAADNRFLTATAEMLYSQSSRLWHLYLAEINDMAPSLDEHRQILEALRSGDGSRAAKLTEDHVRSFETEIRNAMQLRMAGELTATDD